MACLQTHCKSLHVYSEEHRGTKRQKPKKQDKTKGSVPHYCLIILTCCVCGSSPFADMMCMCCSMLECHVCVGAINTEAPPVAFAALVVFGLPGCLCSNMKGQHVRLAICLSSSTVPEDLCMP